MPRKISFRRNSVGSTEKPPDLASDTLTRSLTKSHEGEKQGSFGRKSLVKGEPKTRRTIISPPVLLSTPEQIALSGFKGYETMSLVSGRLQQELGNRGEVTGGYQGHGKAVGTVSLTNKLPAGRSANSQRKHPNTAAGRYRLGTHNEGEEEEDSTEPDSRQLARRRSVKKAAEGERIAHGRPRIAKHK